jgi:polyisoprenoid-binding protein YceI
MKRLTTLLTALCLALVPTLVLAASWTIDPEHSSIQFSVRHLMVSNVKGVFEKVKGAAEIDDKNLTRSSVNVTIETGSINTNVAKRDEHLRSADFFDTATHPTMTFVSKKVAKAGKDKLKVTGDLTIRGITKEVVLDVAGLATVSKDPWGNIRRGATATTKINRKDFGLTWNKALETGGVAVGDDVAITIEVELIKAAAK